MDDLFFLFSCSEAAIRPVHKYFQYEYYVNIRACSPRSIIEAQRKMLIMTKLLFKKALIEKGHWEMLTG